MEDIVGGWWDRLITRIAYRGHPHAAVTLDGIANIAPAFFHAMGGDPALVLRSTVGHEHGARRSWLQRLAGRGDRVELAWSDTQALYLPDKIDLFPEPELNRHLYLWLLALAAEPIPAGDWLTRNRLAAAACLERMPGLAAVYRKLVDALLKLRPEPEKLPEGEAEVERSIRLALLRPQMPLPMPKTFRPPLPVPLWLHPEPPSGADERIPDGGDSAPAERQKQQQQEQKRRRYRAERVQQEQRKDGMLMVFRAESIFTWDEYVKLNRHDDEDEEDNGHAAEDMNRLSLAQDGKSKSGRLRFDLDLPAARYDDTPLGPGLLLPEWNWKTARLVADHCRLQPMLPKDAVASPLPERLKPLARRIRRQFQALAPERTRRNGETSGPDIDIDRVIRFFSERHSQAVAEPALYQAWPPGERSLACLLLADLSLSTESWVGEAGQVIDVIKDSLVLFAEALTASGDSFGLYGFSSIRRHVVRYQLLKDFADRYDDEARGRILALKPGYYTRMGAAIRHSAKILSEQPEQRRLLLIVSDGKPNDLDHYEGRYGIEDTREAVKEARRAGLIPFCVTVDREAGEYLPHLFGSHGYVVVQQAERLPQVLTQLYATLTR